MDEHDKALNLLAYKLQDYEGAERYCSIYSKVYNTDRTVLNDYGAAIMLGLQ